MSAVREISPLLRLPMLLLGMAALVIGSLAGLARVAGGLGESWPLRQGAAIANGIALAVFVVTLLSRVLGGRDARGDAVRRRPA